MRRVIPILWLTLGLMGAAPVHSSSEAPDTMPVTTQHLQTRTRVYTALRIGGAVTTVGLVGLIAGLLWRERRGGGT